MSQRILVVDDSATVRRVVSRTLRDAGYEVSLAADGREALERVQAQVPDLVLVDFVMPHMNGLRFVQAMRQVQNVADVPVVLMSAKADKIGDGFLAQTGALDAITKPFSPDALLAVTGHALTRALEESARDTERPPAPGAAERISILPMPPVPALSGPPASEPLSETSASALSLASAVIAARLAGALAESVEGGPKASVIAERIAERFEPAALFALVRELGRLVPGSDGEDALEGAIEHVPLGDVFQILTQERQTGVIEIEKRPSQSGRSVAVCLRDGSVQLALGGRASRGGGDGEFRLGRYLVREGLIEKAELERIVRNRSGGGLLGTQLVKLGYLSSEELTRVLVAQTSELIYEALRWRRGRYRFVRFASRPEANDAKLGLPLAAILMEGLRRVDEWRLIEEQIRSFDDVPRRDDQALAAVDVSSFSSDERRVLDAVDGTRTVREIVEATQMASFDATKILFQLLTSRLLRRA
jgi:CheY-like chemotaxis protein